MNAHHFHPKGDTTHSNKPSLGRALRITECKLEKDPADAKVLGHGKGKVAITSKDDPKNWVAGDLDAVYYK